MNNWQVEDRILLNEECCTDKEFLWFIPKPTEYESESDIADRWVLYISMIPPEIVKGRH